MLVIMKASLFFVSHHVPEVLTELVPASDAVMYVRYRRSEMNV
jgi:hypothetical protein